MSRSAWLACGTVLGLLALQVPAPAGAAVPSPLPIPEDDERLQPVPAWDSGSPQRLVRFEGGLYQRDSGRLFPVVADRITVRLADGVESWEALVAAATAGGSGAFDGLRQLAPLRRNRLGIVDLATPEGADLAVWCRLVQRTGRVRYAEVATFGEYVATPTDPRYPEQWALNNTGQTGGTPGADVKAETAWDLTAGDPSIVVGVLDSGTDIDHEDLAANVWHNPGEIPGNGVDDDGNGFIDDHEGWDFGNGNNDPRTTYFHGTHVTGIVNAPGNNGLGVVGLAGGLGSPGVQGMAVAVGETAPNGAVLDDAIIYATDNGAQVITLSLSVGETQAINDALAYAYTQNDVFVDCAAGNNGSSVGYPARRPEVMAVASTDHNDVKSGFSNPGPEVEVAAPGSNILSTQLNSTYGTSSGTSFAAPYVAGLAGLIRSRNPGLPAPDVRQLIIDSAVDVGPAGFDNGTGHGRIDAFEAVSLAATSDGLLRLDRDVYSCADSLGLTLSDIDLAGAGTHTVTVESDTEPGGESVLLTESGTGSGVFRGSIATAAGVPSADGTLQVAHLDAIVAEYIDADDGQGGVNLSKTDTASADCLAPLVSAVEVIDVTDTSATVTWLTDEPGTSVVRYGAVTPPAQEASVAGLTTNHNVPLQGLTSCTIYKYEVESTDGTGNLVVDDNAGAYYSFETYGNFPEVGVIPCHQGQAVLDSPVYACSDVVGVSVTDIDLNTDDLVQETISVLLTSSSEPEGETITLTEVGIQSSRFEGQIQLHTGAAVAGDGLLAAAEGDAITVTYDDADDGQGLPRSSTDTSTADCAAPVIGNVQVVDVRASRVVVQWTTDEPATSRIDFGPTAALGTTVEDTTLRTSHSLALSPFQACQQVHFRITGVDQYGSVGVADGGGRPFTFNLNRIGGLVFHDTLETNGGWQLPGEWEIGAPQGLGSSGGDPSAAYSGSGVVGIDLSGQGTFAGDYEPNDGSVALTPVINALGASNLELIFQRKLGVLSNDSASITAFALGATTIWTSGGSINDPGWVEVRYDVSGSADNQPAVQFGFRIDADPSGQSYGWNLDELIVKDATQPDYLACGGCAGAPAFGGLQSVGDPDPCGPGGLSLSWEAAPAWGTGDGGAYDVYRGTTSDFVPDVSNRVATGLTGTGWSDAGAPIDVPVWYVVRARNNEVCAGGEGLDDGNLVRVPGTETVTRALPGSPGAGLVTRRVGAAHVRLSWTPVAGADHYVVRRSEAADFSLPVVLGTTSAAYFEDLGAAENAKFYSYRVSAANACGDETP